MQSGSEEHDSDAGFCIMGLLEKLAGRQIDRIIASRGLVHQHAVTEAYEKAFDNVAQILNANAQAADDAGWGSGEGGKMLSSIETSVWVYAAVYAISISAAMVPLQVGTARRDRDGKDTFTPLPETHPLTSLLSNPNQDMTAVEFIETTLAHAELTGAAYWMVTERKGKSPSALMPPSPVEMQPILEASGITKFEYKTKGRALVLPREDVLYYHYANPANPFMPLSPLASASIAFDSDRYAAQYNRNFFRNNAVVGGILSTDQVISKPQEQEWRQAQGAAWNLAFQGVRNAHRTAILTGGLKYSPVQIPISDIQFGDLRRMNREELLAVFGVPPIMVGILEGNTFANAREQKAQFWQETMLPKLHKLESILTRQLAAQFADNIEIRFDTTDVEALHESNDARAKRGQILVQSGQWTPNEARQTLWQLPPIDGGDVLKPLSNPNAGLLPVNGTMSVNDARVLRSAKALQQWKIQTVKDRAADYPRLIPPAKTDFRAYLAGQKSRIVAAINDGAETLPAMFDVPREVAELVPIMAEHKTRACEAGGTATMRRIDSLRKAFYSLSKAESDPVFDVTNPAVVDYLTQRTEVKSKYVADESRNILNGIMADAVEQGGTWREVSGRILEEVEGNWEKQGDYRAERIARTEVMGAYNYGSTEGMKQAGLASHEWSSSGDADVRDTHRIDTETRRIGAAFSNGVVIPSEEGDDIGELCNCRCVTLPVESELLGD